SSGEIGSPQAGGTTIENITANTGQWKHFTLDVPAGMASFTVTTSGGSGDSDLFVKVGSQATASSYDCRPYKNGNSEACTFSNPQAGTWHLSLNAYQTFSGVTLDAQYQP
ncbi:MAG: PPC domain-containing protein, partial [Pseudoalteromonas sp.]